MLTGGLPASQAEGQLMVSKDQEINVQSDSQTQFRIAQLPSHFSQLSEHQSKLVESNSDIRKVYRESQDF